MRGIKIPLQDFALKTPGGLMREGGGVFAGHYGMMILCSLQTMHLSLAFLSHLASLLLFLKKTAGTSHKKFSK